MGHTVCSVKQSMFQSRFSLVEPRGFEEKFSNHFLPLDVKLGRGKVT